MRIRNLIAGNVALLVLAGLSVQAADMTKFFAKSGSKLRLEGTSNIHDWQVESPIIGGWLEVGPNFPMEPGQSVNPGKVDAKGEAFVTVRSLKSVEKDGKAYSDKMDEVMYEHMKADTDRTAKVTYRLTDLTLKEPAKSKEAPYVFEAKGDLVVAGVTNAVTMPLNVLPLGEKKLKISGNTTVKMTDFKIEPPAPKIALGMIKTGDPVKVIFDWMLVQRAPAGTPTAASAPAAPAPAAAAK
jgi:polyisoprenoid-binding protein YceI